MRLLDLLLTRATSRDLRQERMLVDRGWRGMPHTMTVTAIRLVVIVSFSVVVGLNLSGPWYVSLAHVATSLALGQWAIIPLTRRGAYRNGWVDGRLNAMKMMPAFSNLEDWSKAIAVHDVSHVLGMYGLIEGELRERD